MGTAREELDDQARRELDEETEQHRRALKALTVRDVDGVVAEATRHLERVKEIMRDFALRKRQSG
jgi:DNA-binding GntR family transcriptional regulator